MDRIESMKAGIRHKGWREMYEKYLSSGKTVTKWCAENGVSKKTFYYRLRKIRGEATEQNEQHEIVPIVLPPISTDVPAEKIRISGYGINIELPANISSEAVTAAIRGLRSC